MFPTFLNLLYATGYW